MSAVKIESLSVRRGNREVLHGIEYEVAAGAVVGILGPSGCGKSTLMRAIVGVQIISAGSVTVLGDPAGTASLRSRVGYVTQAPSIYGDLSVGQNLRYFARILGADEDRVAEVVETVSLGDRTEQVVDEMSGGQRARVSLATALLGRPELLVLDEPTVGLDPVLRRDLWNYFRLLAGQGVTLIVSSHAMDEAEHCDELMLMRDGSVLAASTPHELLTRTGTDDLEQAFLALIEAEQPA